MTEAGLCEIVVQVSPARIHLPDEVNLPSPIPLLHPLFSQNCLFHRVVRFVPDETVEVVTFGETFDELLLMRPDASWEIGGDSDVQRAVRLVGQDVDAGDLSIDRHGWCVLAEGGGGCFFATAAWVPAFAGMTE